MRKIAIGFIVLLLCISVASAGQDNKNKDDGFTLINAKDLGYKVVPVKSDDGGISIMSITDTITQGETNWHYVNINSYYDSLNVDLNWGDSSDSLKLYIYDPSYNCIGTFYDSADGSINGRINLYISRNGGIEQGTWRYRVYGYSVSGTEDYSI
ncbi:peptidase domain-containing protein [Methanolobus sp. WCC4]|uniref:peptidase domain-containing protein n=1 Tax=Methanolobus sp. WCC4 TaxID=3125784 RepID=UPI0030F619A4